ncbi:MAG TPA: hypothetical protein VGV59_02545 [Pyrinomonadaceae bacterium]|nr:hypothetical protein [Pyrinomonadaceae bacterium]
MRTTIRKLFGASLLFALLALATSYFGYQQSLTNPRTPVTASNDLARQFAGSPGDGWMLAGGFLMLIALAVVGAAAMLWAQERKSGG